MEPVPGPHAGTDRVRETQVAEPWRTAQRDGRPGEGQHLTPDTPHNEGRPPPQDGPLPPPRHAAPSRACKPKGQRGPPRPHTCARSTWVADPDSPPLARAAGGGRAPALRHPSQRRKATPPGCPSATSTARNDSSQERTLWGWCWIPTSSPTAPGKHGSRNPGCPPHGTGARGRDSA